MTSSPRSSAPPKPVTNLTVTLNLDETDLKREVVAILTAARGWKVLQQRESLRRFAGGILASHTELGRERRYAIECVMEINGQTVRDYYGRFSNWVHQNKRPFADFDDFWVVGYKYSDEAIRKNPGNDRHFRVFDLSELRTLLAPPAGRRRKGKARTKIGKAVEANGNEIILLVAGLILQIDDKIEALRRERRNSDEAIVEYERMRRELKHIQTMIAAFKEGTEKENNVVKSVEAFEGRIRSWWNKDHEAIIATTFKVGLFVTAVSICAMAGATGNMVAVMAGALVDRKSIIEVLKSIPKRFIGG